MQSPRYNMSALMPSSYARVKVLDGLGLMARESTVLPVLWCLCLNSEGSQSSNGS